MPYTDEQIAQHYSHVDDYTGRRYRLSDLSANKPGGDVEYEWRGVKPPTGRYWAYSKANMERFERENKLYYTKTGRPFLKRYLDVMPGNPAQDVWSDVRFIHGSSQELLGYKTQKPLTLLERIIQASSNEDDILLDPFCGCGTAVVAAHKLNRRWIGIDVTNLAITVMRKRLNDAFPGIEYKVIGEPTTLSEARSLAEQKPEGRYQFQWWTLGLISALPASDSRRKGADAGVDGFFSVHHDTRGKFTQVIVQVKSGHVGPSLIRDLAGTIGDDKLGVFITLEEPTQAMKAAATSAGLYDNPLMSRKYPRVQILTVEDLLNGKQPNLPPRVQGAAGPRIGQRIRQGTLSV